MQTLPFVSPWNKAPIYYREITSSTMQDAEAILGLANAHGSVVTADFQTQGRGRFVTREWESEKACNLLFTLVLGRDTIHHPESLLPLLAGLAVARTIERLYSLRVNIKWPNDVLIDGKKAAGILCLGKKDFLLTGVGINCNQTVFVKNADRATSLACVYGQTVDRTGLLIACLQSLKQVLDGADWRAELEARLFLSGKSCTVVHHIQGNESRERGIIMGIGERGELIFKPEKSHIPRRFFSAQISIVSK